MSIRVRDIMQKEIHTVTSGMSASDLERAFLERRVSGFPVVDSGRLVGLVTRSDIVRTLNVEHVYEEQLSDYYGELGGVSYADSERSSAEMGARVGARLESLKVADLMVRAVVTASPDHSLQEVAALLVEHGVHRLPVVQNGALVGIVTSLDLVRCIADGSVQASG